MKIKSFVILIIIMGAVFLSSLDVLTKKSHLIDIIPFRGDPLTYQVIAVNLLKGHGFRQYFLENSSVYKLKKKDAEEASKLWSFKKRYVNFYHSPGYPFFLWMIYKIGGIHPVHAYQVQIILLAISAALLPLIAFFYWNSWGAISGIGGALVFIYFFSPYPFLTNAETLLVFLFALWALFFSLFEKKPSLFILILLGIISGFTILVKGTFIFVPLVFLIYLTSGNIKTLKVRRYSLVYMLCLILMILPWSIYASIQKKKIIFICEESASNLLSGNNERTIKTGTWSKEWSVNHDYLYSQLGRKYSKFEKLLYFLVKNFKHIPEMLWNKFLSAFNGTWWILFWMFVYYLFAFYFRYTKSHYLSNSPIPPFPIFFFLSIFFISLIFFGLDRFTLPFLYVFLIPASYGPFYLMRIILKR